MRCQERLCPTADFYKSDTRTRQNERLRHAVRFPPMPQQASFDVTTGVDLQEGDNAVNQAQKEISQRYDFKGSPATIELNRGEGKINLTAENDYKMNAVWNVLQSKLIRRGV